MGLLFNNNPLPENNINPLNKPDSEKPVPFSERKFESPSNPPAKGFMDTLFGKRVQIPKKPEKGQEVPKSIFEKRKEGLTRSELRAELKKVPYDVTVKLYEKARMDVEKEMERKKYGENVDIKDIDKHIKDLKKKESLSPYEEDRLAAKHKRILLEKLKEKKK